MAKTATRGVDLEPIDRLEEKVTQLVGLVDRLRGEQARATEENQRLSREIELLQTKVSAGETIGVELSALREERDVIRTRVTEMLDQLESLNL